MRNSIAFGLILTVMLAPLAAGKLAQSPAAKASYVSYQEALPILDQMRETMPAELRAAGPENLPAAWSKWIIRRDKEIRSRLVQGDEDSLVNFMLFGTSFTKQPRVTLNSISQLAAKSLQPPTASQSETFKIISARAEDLAQALAAPGQNERLLFARRLVETKGLEVKSAAGRERVKQYLFDNLSRVISESESYAKMLESARLLGDASAEFVERSKLYSGRGLSSDTSLRPNFAIERALAKLKANGLVTNVRRVGIIGPGLDFADKQDGYDFYPQQTIQPFAVIDSLIRLGLARANDLQITTFDLSPRVNDHLRRAGERARSGVAYTIQLPRETHGSWKPELIEYWSRFGDRIGTPAPPVAVPAGLADVKLRAVRIRPAVAALISAEDVNIVLERPDIQPGRELDLIIATNIFVYYDMFEQSLALANVGRILRRGGLLLSNNALLELPVSLMRSVGYETVVYSDKPDDGDHIVWYQRAADR